MFLTVALARTFSRLEICAGALSVAVFRCLFATVFFLQIFVTAVSAQNNPFLVFAAASLRDALDAISSDFERETGQKVTISYAGTATLARQVAAGAPADLFISADIDWATWLQAQGLSVPETRRVVVNNRLALVGPSDTSLSATASVEDNILRWRDGSEGRLAVADPETIPAGRYARSALKFYESVIGSYDAIAQRFAIAESVRFASLLVARREVPLGIVYLSDAVVDPRLKVLGIFPSESHPKIVYPALRLKDGRPEADAFLDYLSTPKALEHFKAVGLIVPVAGQ